MFDNMYTTINEFKKNYIKENINNIDSKGKELWNKFTPNERIDEFMDEFAELFDENDNFNLELAEEIANKSYDELTDEQKDAVKRSTSFAYIKQFNTNENLRSVTVKFKNGDEINTNMAAHVTDEEIKDYYRIGKEFNLGSGENDNMSTVEEVIINESKINEAIEQMPRLSNTVLDALNAQIKNELVSSQIYRGMSVWLDDKGWPGATKYYFKTGGEELIHMDKIYNYIFDRNSKAVVPGCESVKQEFESIRNVVEESLEHEIQVTKQWEAIAQLAKTEGDNTTYTFAQWYIVEQQEEEKKFRDLLFKFDLDMPNWKIDELFETL